MKEERVPLMNLARLHESIRPDLDSAFATVTATSAFVGAESCQSFEVAFAHAHGAAAAAGTASGTDALALALRASGVGAGDEVIVPSMTFVATGEAIVHAGAVPVVADVDPETLLLSPSAVEAVRTDRTRAVIPVHLYGHVVPFEVLSAWRQSGLIVVEDAAQAHMATWEGRYVGSIGQAACFSFYPGKNLGALGDAGMVVSQDREVIAEVMHLRDHGRRSKHEHDTIGWCSRMDGLQAAFLEAKLAHLPAWTESRRRLAHAYEEGLSGVGGIGVIPSSDGAVHHLLVVRIETRHRDDVRRVLSDEGIGTGVHYPVPLSRQPAFARWSTSCPVAEAAGSQILSLPLDPLIETRDVELVCEVLREAVT
jgi:dTDP-4-amino-4,6-dideoxygalactose transaminase